MERKLGEFEKKIWKDNKETSFNFVVAADIQGNIPEKILKDSINILQKSHPILNMQVIEKENNFYLSKKDFQIPLIFKNMKNTIEWNKEISNELNFNLRRENEALARILLFSQPERNTLLITFNHIIADAISGINLLHELIKIVDALINRSDVNIKNYRFLPSIEDLLEIKNDDFISIHNTSNSQVNIKPFQEIKQLTSITHHQLSESDTAKILNLCHVNNISVHSYVCACLSYALFEARKFKFDKLMCLTPVNMRPYLSFPVHPNELGYFLSRIDIMIRYISQRDIIENAKFINKQLKKNIELNLHHEVIRNISQREITDLDYPDYSHTNPTLLVSNVGAIKLPNHFSHIIIKNMHFFLATQGIITHKHSFASTITTFNNRMTINFHYQEPATLLVEANEFMQVAIRNLIN